MLRIMAWATAFFMAAVWLLILSFTFPVLITGQMPSIFSWTWAPSEGKFGILPMLSASLLLATSALTISMPLAVGIAARLQLSGTHTKNSLLGFIRFMTTIPTVVYGFASVFLLVPIIRDAFLRGSGLCWLSAMLILALLILPTMILLIDTALRASCQRTTLSAAALGFSPEEALLYFTLPLSRRWIIRAGVLGFGRAVGDTLIPLMLAGNAPQIADSLFSSIRALSAHMALVTATEAGSPAYNSLFVAAAFLLIISVCISVATRRTSNEKQSFIATSHVYPSFYAPHIVRFWSLIATVLVLGAICTLGVFLLSRGLPAFSLSLFFGDADFIEAIVGEVPVWDGIWPACAGTLSLLVVTMGLSIVPGICAGVYLSEYASSRTKAFFALTVDTMAGMPSIVMGIFGFLLLLLIRRTIWPNAQPGLFLASMCLALLILPVLIVSTRSALESVPNELRLSSHALGFSHSQVLWRVLLPQASNGILSGVMLAIGRAAEDTAVIILTGVVANAGVPSGLFARFEALPFMIYYTAAEYQNTAELMRGFGAALLLLCVSSAFLLIAQSMQRQYLQRHRKGKKHELSKHL